MGHHTFDASDAARLERAERRYRYLSAEELRWALDSSPEEAVLDLGSGTGFYTDVVAPDVGTVYAVDLQPAMHAHYREKGLPENVTPLTGAIDAIPLASDSVDAAFSTMTYHEFASETALAEIGRVLAEGGRLVTVDWAASGTGTAGPPLAERYECQTVVDALESASFDVEFTALRPETYLVVATAG